MNSYQAQLDSYLSATDYHRSKLLEKKQAIKALREQQHIKQVNQLLGGTTKFTPLKQPRKAPMNSNYSTQGARKNQNS